ANDVYAESVLFAVEKGMEECRNQFEWDRWNCPRSSFNLFSRSDKQPSTREMAFLHSVVSAAIVISITKNCSLGHFSTCGCDESKKGGFDSNGFHWGGCSDHLKTGNRMSKLYLDNRETGRDLKALVNLHNNRVGRVVVKKTMKKTCKCHGISGSCEIQTCWMRVRNLKEVGKTLKDTYLKANHVEFNVNGFNLPPVVQKRSRALGKKTHDQLNVPKRQLAFLDESPNYCYDNKFTGPKGTLGRTCSRSRGKGVSKAQRTSCKELCRSCGYRVKVTSYQVKKNNCDCKFTFCCEVNCKNCTESVLEHSCVVDNGYVY
ncbi:protein Wnt-8, partial [Caerostris extrusa]